MKKLGVLTVVVLTFVLAVSVAVAGPSSLPGSGWWSPFQIQNVGDDTATVTYSAYWQVGQGGDDSDMVYTQDGDITVNQGASVTYNPALAPNYPTGSRIGFDTTDKHLPQGFAGGVEIASDQPLRAVVTVNNFESGGGAVGVTGGRASAYYQSVQEPATSLFFPVVKSNFFGQHTNFYIQAAGGDATINATFSYDGGPATVTGVNIPDGKAYLLDPEVAGVPVEGNGTLGSLVVEATSGQIAGVVIEAQYDVTVGTFALSTKGFSPDAADTTIVAPTNKTGYFGGNTGWQIQNTTSTTATAMVTFTVSGVAAGSAAETVGIEVGDQFAAEIEVPADGSYLFSEPNGNYYKAVEVGGTMPMTEGLFFSGLAVSTQPLVATVNENNGPNRILYSAFGTGSATTQLAAPAVKEAFYNQRTSLNVQNVGDASTTPSVVYNCGSVTETYTFNSYKAIAPGEAVNFFMLSDPGHGANGWGAVQVPAGNNCAVTVSAGEPIVAVAQESIAGGSQDIKNYEGFNLP